MRVILRTFENVTHSEQAIETTVNEALRAIEEEGFRIVDLDWFVTRREWAGDGKPGVCRVTIAVKVEEVV